MKQLVRREFSDSGYVFAQSAEEIAAKYGFDKIAMLGSNENPYPPSDKVTAAAISALKYVNRYPDPKNSKFKEAVRKYILDSCIAVSGNGMDGVIETVIRTLVNPKEKIAISMPTFSVYSLMAKAASAEIISIPRENDFSADADEFIEKAKDAKLSFLCSPNNPTGTVTPAEDIEKILKNTDGVLFLDCAYAEFSDIDYSKLLRYDNLIIGRTMSKVYGLAGLRIGYAFIPKWLESPYNSAATPFTLSRVSEDAAAAALSDTEYRNNFIAHVKKWREIFVREIPYPVYESGANFVLFNTAPLSSDYAVERLAEKGVIVRSCRSFPGLGDTYVRVSIGDDWENMRFLSAVKNL